MFWLSRVWSCEIRMSYMLSIQKSPLDKLVQVLKIASLFLRLIPQTLFLLLSLSRVRLSNKPKLLLLGRLGLIFKSLKLRLLTFLRTRCTIDLHGFVIFVESLGTFVQIVSSCKLLSEQISQKYLCLKHKILWYLLVNW